MLPKQYKNNLTQQNKLLRNGRAMSYQFNAATVQLEGPICPPSADTFGNRDAARQHETAPSCARGTCQHPLAYGVGLTLIPHLNSSSIGLTIIPNPNP